MIMWTRKKIMITLDLHAWNSNLEWVDKCFGKEYNLYNICEEYNIIYVKNII